MSYRMLVPKDDIHILGAIDLDYARQILELRLGLANDPDVATQLRLQIQMDHLAGELRARKRAVEKLVKARNDGLAGHNDMDGAALAMYMRLLKFIPKSKDLSDEIIKYDTLNKELARLMTMYSAAYDPTKEIKQTKKLLKKQLKKVVRKIEILETLLQIDEDESENDTIIDTFVERLSTALRER